MKLVMLSTRVWVNPEHVETVTHDGGRDVVQVEMISGRVHILKSGGVPLRDFAREIRALIQQSSEED